MANDKDWKDWGKEMEYWCDQIIEWQEANPDKDWLQEMGTADTSAEGGGDHPPLPPIKP